MTTLHNILKKRDARRDAPEPPVHIFPELNIEKIKDDLDLEKEGRARGEKNTPPSTSDALDDIEHGVIAAIEAEQRRQQQALNSQLSVYHQHIPNWIWRTRQSTSRPPLNALRPSSSSKLTRARPSSSPYGAMSA